MPQRPSIDDTNTTLIQYTGDWQYLEGSTRQWNGGVHLTGQEGATATFSFRVLQLEGYQVWVRGTVPAGSGSNLIDVALDGNTTSSSRQSNVSAVYDEVYFASPILQNTFHTLVITNRGSEQNGHTEFLFDRLEFDTDDEVPLFAPPSNSTSGGQPSTTSSSGQQPTTSKSQSIQAKKTPVGGIVGGVIGALAIVVVAILVCVFLRKRRTRKGNSAPQPGPSTTTQGSVAVTPYPVLSAEPTLSSKEGQAFSHIPVLPRTQQSSANATIISTTHSQEGLSHVTPQTASYEISGVSPSSKETNLTDPLPAVTRDSIQTHVHGPPPSYEVDP